jgi:hypothetical protein
MANTPTRSDEAGSFAWAEIRLLKSRSLSAEDLALVLENNPDKPLTPVLRDYAIKFLRKQRERGRKGRSAPALDFILGDADLAYQEKLLEFHEEARRRKKRAKAAGKTLSRAEKSASERAYEFVCVQFKDQLGAAIDWRVMRNYLSLYRQGRYPPLPEEDHEN